MQFEIIDERRTRKQHELALTILSRAFFWLWIPAALLIALLARGGLHKLIAEQLGLHPVTDRDMHGLAHLIGFIMLWAGFIGYAIVLVFLFWLVFLLGSGIFA